MAKRTFPLSKAQFPTVRSSGETRRRRISYFFEQAKLAASAGSPVCLYCADAG